MKSNIDTTPKKNMNNNLNSFNNDEIDAILKSYFLDGNPLVIYLFIMVD